MRKLLFDLFPLILFFIAFRAFDIYTATAVAMGAAVAQIAWLKLRHKLIETTHWINLGVIVIFGSATLFFQNDAFIKWKPTVLYWLFAAVLLGAYWFTGRNLMQKFMGGQLVLPTQAWTKLNYGWATFFILSGSINLFVAFSGYFTESQWVSFKVFGSLVLLVIFVVIQSLWLSKYLKDQPNTDQQDS